MHQFYLPASVGTGMVDLTPVTVRVVFATLAVVGTLPGSGAIVRLEPEFGTDAPVLERLLELSVKMKVIETLGLCIL